MLDFDRCIQVDLGWKSFSDYNYYYTHYSDGGYSIRRQYTILETYSTFYGYAQRVWVIKDMHLDFISWQFYVTLIYE